MRLEKIALKWIDFNIMQRWFPEPRYPRKQCSSLLEASTQLMLSINGFVCLSLTSFWSATFLAVIINDYRTHLLSNKMLELLSMAENLHFAVLCPLRCQRIGRFESIKSVAKRLWEHAICNCAHQSNRLHKLPTNIEVLAMKKDSFSL